MAVYGYARCSTKKQDPARQLRAIRAIDPSAKFFFDAYTGTQMDGRKDWSKLMKIVKSGDTIIFDGVSRMSRNADEGIEAYKKLFEMGVNLVFIKDPHINTDVYREAIATKVPMTGTDADIILVAINEYLLCVAEKQIRIAFEQSEDEVLRLRQRTSEGIVTAKLNGKQIGRAPGKEVVTKKSIHCKKMIRELSRDFNGTLTDTELIQLLDISRATYYKYKGELRYPNLEVDAAALEDE